MSDYRDEALPSHGGLWLAHLSTEDVIKVGQEWEATKQQNRPFFLEHRFQKSSEETVWVVNRAVAEYDATGAVVGYVGTLTDITTRKQAEQQLQDFNRILEQRVHDRTAALQDSRHLIQRITETSPDILYIYDVEEEQMVYVNREITVLLGYPASEAAALGPTWFQSLLHPDDRDRVAQHYQEIRGIPATELTKAVREIEYRMRNRDGQWHWFSSRESFFFVNAQGFVQQVIGAASEITAQKNIEAQLRQSHTDLAQATRLKNQFLSAMSHELRTPLNAVLGMTEALLSQAYGALNHRQESALQTMARSGNELLRLISDILTLVQIEAQSLNLQKTLVNPAQLCTQTAALVQTQARRKNINLKLQLQLPSTPIELDTQQIQKMLLNLLSNGIKFTPSGGTVTLHGTYLIWSDSLHSTPPLLTLHTPAPAGTPTCCLSIEDTGIGMAAHDIDQLFQPFVQGDGRLTRQQGGTGLGLALVKQILELHQGWLQVWSSANQGSRFVIYLPWHPIPQEITASFSPAADLTSAPEPVTPEPVTPEPVAPSPAPLPKPDANPDSPNPDVTSLAPAVAPTVATPPPTGTDRSAPPASPPRMISPAPSVAVQPTQQAHRRLLLADANEANIASFSDYLSQRGYEVIVATTAPEVLIRVQADQPDLLLMDLQSPKMGGPQIISQLRARSDYTHLPILVLCPADRPEANTPAIEAGATLLIPKPIRLKDLSAIIRQHITPPHPT
ncbi:MAG: ATP-binding protein [Prochlorothrix sp.]|nr:ATP-binding protein [Prochlorothrix sp.]